MDEREGESKEKNIQRRRLIIIWFSFKTKDASIALRLPLFFLFFFSPLLRIILIEMRKEKKLFSFSVSRKMCVL